MSLIERYVENPDVNFEEWLTNQQMREDNIGILAQVLLEQELQTTFSKRKSDEHRHWADIVMKIEETGYIYVFNVAWQEYVKDKKAAEEGSN